MKSPKPPVPRPPWFVLIFISMFGFVGLTLLIFLWSQSPHEFGAPPLIAKMFGSFIAIAFMAMGFGMPISALLRWSMGETGGRENPDPNIDEGVRRDPTGYRCPHCGAGLGTSQEVSPSGDVKCNYCQKWWNIHQSAG